MFNNKLAQGMGGGKNGIKAISILLGLIMIFLAVVQLGLVQITLPAIPALILHVLLAIGGIFLIIDALMIRQF